MIYWLVKYDGIVIACVDAPTYTSAMWKVRRVLGGEWPKKMGAYLVTRGC